jgi:hypothetical protein
VGNRAAVEAMLGQVQLRRAPTQPHIQRASPARRSALIRLRTPSLAYHSVLTCALATCNIGAMPSIAPPGVLGCWNGRPSFCQLMEVRRVRGPAPARPYLHGSAWRQELRRAQQRRPVVRQGWELCRPVPVVDELHPPVTRSCGSTAKLAMTCVLALSSSHRFTWYSAYIVPSMCPDFRWSAEYRTFWMQTTGGCQVGASAAGRQRCLRSCTRAVVRPRCCTSCCTDRRLASLGAVSPAQPVTTTLTFAGQRRKDSC